MTFKKVYEVARTILGGLFAVFGAIAYTLSWPASVIGGGLLAWSSYVAGEGIFMAVVMFIAGSAVYGIALVFLAAAFLAIAGNLVK